MRVLCLLVHKYLYVCMLASVSHRVLIVHADSVLRSASMPIGLVRSAGLLALEGLKYENPNASRADICTPKWAWFKSWLIYPDQQQAWFAATQLAPIQQDSKEPGRTPPLPAQLSSVCSFASQSLSICET